MGYRLADVDAFGGSVERSRDVARRAIYRGVRIVDGVGVPHGTARQRRCVVGDGSTMLGLLLVARCCPRGRRSYAGMLG